MLKKSKDIKARIPMSEEEKEIGDFDLDSSDNITWRIFRIMSEFVTGFHFIQGCDRTVSFFGSARTDPRDHYYKEAHKLAIKLGKNRYKIVTGGGPGIMEAGNRGAKEAGVDSIGLNIQLPFEQRANKYITKGTGFHYFFTRKVMLSAAGQAYVFFPGGYGTLDEFFELVTLIQTRKMEKIPVVLYGSEFWNPLIKWIDKVVCKEFSNVDKEDTQIYKVVDKVEDAYAIIKKSKPRKDF